MKNILFGFALGLYCYVSLRMLKQLPNLSSERDILTLLIRVIEMLPLILFIIFTGKSENTNLMGIAVSALILIYFIYLLQHARYYFNATERELMTYYAERLSSSLPTPTLFFGVGLTMNIAVLCLSIKSGFLRKKRNT